LAVTGCDFGLGAEVAKAALGDGYRVFAGCLKPARAREMRALEKSSGGRLDVFGVDLGNEASVRRAAAWIGRRTRRLDVLVNNAGIYWTDGLDRVDFASLRRMHEVNAFGPLCLVRHLRPLLAASGKGRIVNVSSEAGSMGGVRNARPIYAYAASKSALNMFTRRLSHELAGEGTRVISIHPGWMRTPMGRAGGNPTQEPAETARDILRLVSRMGAAMNGGFFLHSGERYPW
jgi:NAD(P)-dependent dehydrogenase (short-subunit alcohol dehydrogenase family)